METPFVSVCMITYNHEPYIREAIEGVIMQKTDFPIELIIGEDCSTDNTRRIVRKYESQYPEIIFAQYPETNRGMINNFKTVLQSARGKYIALCEGDDYWTDPLKLQKQVDFLEANPDYSMCFHNAVVHYEDHDKKDHLFAQIEDRDYTGIEIYKSWIVPTASVVLKKDVINSIWYTEVKNSTKIKYGDTPCFISASMIGKVFGSHEVMAAYRKHSTGMTNNYLKDIYSVCNHYIEISRIFGKEFLPVSKQKVANSAIIRAMSLFYHGKISIAPKLFFIALLFAPVESSKKILLTLLCRFK